MTLKEYQRLASRTCPDLGSLKLNLSHMVMGLQSEQEEYLKAISQGDLVNVREELADQWWYVANYCNFRSISLSELVPDANDLMSISIDFDQWELESQVYYIYQSRLTDLVKKYVAYNREIDRNTEINTLKGIVWGLLYEDMNFDIGIDLEKNINKLKVRYPEKFTDELANNRDLEAERKTLE